MSFITQNRWFRRLGLAAVAAVALGTATIPTAPAEAALRVFGGPEGVSVGIVQHPHHDWWRQPYVYYQPYGYHHHGWYDHGWHR